MSTQKPERHTEITYKIGTVLRNLNLPPPPIKPKISNYYEVWHGHRGEIDNNMT